VTRRSTLIAPSLAVLAFAGCGDNTVDSGSAEKLIKQVGNGAIDSAACPGDVKFKSGGSFECKATLRGGAPATVTVHMRGKDQIAVAPADLRTASP
jgi:hypothetical protein